MLASFLASLESVEDFQGACVDSGAERSVIGKPQAEAYYCWLGKDADLELAAAPQVYGFGGGLHKSVAKAHVRIPFAGDFVLNLHVDFAAGLFSLRTQPVPCAVIPQQEVTPRGRVYHGGGDRCFCRRFGRGFRHQA